MPTQQEPPKQPTPSEQPKVDDLASRQEALAAEIDKHLAILRGDALK
ncbi:hypothetical protein [Streptomyces sp. x-80]